MHFDMLSSFLVSAFLMALNMIQFSLRVPSRSCNYRNRSF